jgi:hypothetical protein
MNKAGPLAEIMSETEWLAQGKQEKREDRQGQEHKQRKCRAGSPIEFARSNMALLSCLCLLCSFTVNYKVLTAAEWCR